MNATDLVGVIPLTSSLINLLILFLSTALLNFLELTVNKNPAVPSIVLINTLSITLSLVGKENNLSMSFLFFNVFFILQIYGLFGNNQIFIVKMSEKIKTLKGSVIKRSPKYGVGKQMGSAIYVHKSAEDVLPPEDLNRAKQLGGNPDYEVVKYDTKTGNVTFIGSPDWDTSDEPIVGDAVLVKLDGSVKLIKQKSSPQIYHHKWLFVRDNYTGFNIQDSMNRSRKWLSIPNVDFARIGYKSFWDANVVPLIETRMRNTIKRILRESYDDINPDFISKANRSSRRGGAVGPNAVTPKAVVDYVGGNPDMTILDFGAGKFAKHAESLRDLGLNVTAHEFSGNVDSDLHDPDALSRQYDVVFASNVLNVQGSENMFERTIRDVLNVMKPDGVFIANYPGSPRYGYESTLDAKQHLLKYFDVEPLKGRDTSRTASPIWIMRKK
jgi:hypothetical protein